MKTRMKEIGKNILIVLLIGSLLLLSVLAIPTRSISALPWLSQLLQPMAPLLGLSEAELTYVEQSEPVPDAAQPIAISINNDTGRHTAMWDFTALDEAFAVFAPVLAQALDASENFNLVSEYQVQSAISGSSVTFVYGGLLPAPLMASWLGGTLNAAIDTAGTCILAAQDGTLTLYLLDKNHRYAARTELSDQLLLPLLELYSADGSAFVFETDYPLSPMSLLPGNTPSAPACSFSNPCDSRFVDALATTLGFNPYAETRYTDDRGTDCFSETGASLEVSTSGHVLFRTENARYTAAGTDPEDLTETARQLTDTILEDVAGDGRLYLSSMSQDGDTTVCEFDYFISGIPVQLSEPAARVRFSKAAVTEVSIALYSFAGTGKTLYPLPIAQAAAVLEDGSPLELAYRLGPDGALNVGWVQ